MALRQGRNKHDDSEFYQLLSSLGIQTSLCCPSETDWTLEEKIRKSDDNSALAYEVYHGAARRLDRPLWIKVPQSWVPESPDFSLDSIKSYQDAEDQCFRAAVYVANDCVSFFSLCPVLPQNPPYPQPDLSLNPFPDSDPRSLRKSFLTLLTGATTTSYEMPIAESMVCVLQGFFQIPGCLVSYGASCSSSLLQFSGRSFQKDRVLTARMEVPSMSETLWPPLLVAFPWDSRPYEEGQALLAAIFEWPLSFFIILHSREILSSDPDSSLTDILPTWCWLPGILYGPKGVSIYAHRPRWDTSKRHWKFVSTLVNNTFHSSLVNESYHSRIGMAVAFLVAQRHASLVRQRLQEIIANRKLPPEFRRC